MTTRSRHCRVCGYPLTRWKGPILDRCPYQQTPGLCPEAVELARGEAVAMRLVPHLFDASGVVLEGKLAEVYTAVQDAGLDPSTGLPLPPTPGLTRAL